MDRRRLLAKLEKAWTQFEASFAGLSEAELVEPGVTGDWSVRDIIAHVTWWEAEALRHVPTILDGGRTPRYADTYGGIDAFNAQMTERAAGLSLAEVLRQKDETHRRLVALVGAMPEDQIVRETRARRRLRFDTYGHYPEHAEAIRRWREVRERSAADGE